MDKFLYELKPYFYGVVGIYALITGKGSLLMTVSGALLGLACISIMLLRHDSRNQAVAINKKGKSNPTVARSSPEKHFGQDRYHIG